MKKYSIGVQRSKRRTAENNKAKAFVGKKSYGSRPEIIRKNERKHFLRHAFLYVRIHLQWYCFFNLLKG